MSEVKTSPLLGTDANGDPTYTFTSAHTFGDVARWIASEGGAEDVAFMLSEAALTRATPDQTAALDKLIAEAEARGKTVGAATEKIRRLVEWLQDDEDNIFLLPHDAVVEMCAILAASKKGGV